MDVTCKFKSFNVNEERWPIVLQLEFWLLTKSFIVCIGMCSLVMSLINITIIM